jgi:hypothetical protein
MKKIIVNGCSFIAGDELVWKDFCIQKFGIEYPWKEKNFELHSEYVLKYRPYRNFSKLLADCLGVSDVKDLSRDGNSNDMIALETISFLLGLPEDERQDCHVCIGWTLPARIMKFMDESSTYVNLLVQLYDDKNYPHFSSVRDYIRVTLIDAFDDDHIMNYARNVLLLENFLKSNSVTYTFFRSLGNKNYFKKNNFEPFQTFHMEEKEKFLRLPMHLLSDSTNWYDFQHGKSDIHPMYDNSWCDTDVMPNNFISKENFHPNMKAVLELVQKIGDFIKSR